MEAAQRIRLIRIIEKMEKNPALGKNAYAIHQSGKWYTNENIDQMLMERHLNKKARRASGKKHLRGPRKRTSEDDEHFRESFEKMIHMAMDKEN